MIEVLTKRYEWPVTPDTPSLQSVYAEEMELLAGKHAGTAPLLHVVCAEAWACLSPWDLYGKDKALNNIGLKVCMAFLHSCWQVPTKCQVQVGGKRGLR